jgi:nucleoside phosphorylase
MDRELAGLARRLARRETATVAGYAVTTGELGGRPVVLCRSGLGERAGGAVPVLLGRCRASALLSVGVCGALDTGLRSGDLVLCESVETASAAQPIRSDDGLLRLAEAAAREARLPVGTGRSLTVERVVAAPADKAALRLSSGADVVEMEGYWLGRAAQEAGLAFLAARAVLDEAAHDVPPLTDLIRADGSHRALGAVAYVLRRPYHLPGLVGTAAAERRALGSLARFLEAFVAAAKAATVVKPA